jgi:hypothetical protein
MTYARGGLGLLGDLAERRDVVDRDVGQGLAVQLDVRLQQAVHEAAVAQAVHAGRGVDAHDPQRTELALALLAADVRVLRGLRDRLLGDAIDLATGGVIALRGMEGALVARACGDTTFDSSHGSVSSGVGKQAIEAAGIFRTGMVGPAEIALTLGRLLGEDVAAVRVAALVLAGSGLPEALGGSAVGLDLGHWKSCRLFVLAKAVARATLSVLPLPALSH